MTEISKSPERHTWRRNLYLQKLEEDPNDNDALLTVDFLESIRKQDSKKLEDPVWKENNLEYDLRTTDWILEKVRSREDYPQHVYAALCNMQWQKIDIIEILKDQPWSCSMRYAGGIVADMREEGDYIDWYCSGMGIGLGNGDESGIKGYVSEGHVTDEIKEDFKKLGWIAIEWPEDNIL